MRIRLLSRPSLGGYRRSLSKHRKFVSSISSLQFCSKTRLVVAIVPAAAGFGMRVWVFPRGLFLQGSAGIEVRFPIPINDRFYSKLVKNSRNLFGDVIGVATSLSSCCHAFRECRACPFQSALGKRLQFSQLSLLCVHSSGSVK
jgi:hypothetical protein